MYITRAVAISLGILALSVNIKSHLNHNMKSVYHGEFSACLPHGCGEALR